MPALQTGKPTGRLGTCFLSLFCFVYSCLSVLFGCTTSPGGVGDFGGVEGVSGERGACGFVFICVWG